MLSYIISNVSMYSVMIHNHHRSTGGVGRDHDQTMTGGVCDAAACICISTMLPAPSSESRCWSSSARSATTSSEDELLALVSSSQGAAARVSGSAAAVFKASASSKEASRLAMRDCSSDCTRPNSCACKEAKWDKASSKLLSWQRDLNVSGRTKP